MKLYKVLSVLLLLIIILQWFALNKVYENYLNAAGDEFEEVIFRSNIGFYLEANKGYPNLQFNHVIKGRQYEGPYRSLIYEWEFLNESEENLEALRRRYLESSKLGFYGVETEAQLSEGSFKLVHQVNWSKDRSLKLRLVRKMVSTTEKLNFLGGK